MFLCSSRAVTQHLSLSSRWSSSPSKLVLSLPPHNIHSLLLCVYYIYTNNLLASQVPHIIIQFYLLYIYVHYTFGKYNIKCTYPIHIYLRTLSSLTGTAAMYSNALCHLPNSTQSYHPEGEHLCALCAQHQATNNAVGHVNNRFTEIKRTITRYFPLWRFISHF